MFKKILNVLEDPSRPLLGPHVKTLKFFGLLLPDNLSMKYFYIFLHFAAISQYLLQCVDLWMDHSDIYTVLESTNYILCASVSFFKVVSFNVWQKHWETVIDYITEADIEQRKTTNPTNMAIIEKFTRYCRTCTFLLWSTMMLTVISTALVPIVKFISSPTYRWNVKNGTETYDHIMKFWVPFDTNTPLVYFATLIYEYFTAIYSCCWVLAFNTIAITIMVFFKGELELLRRDSSQIFGTINDPVTDEEALERIKTCHNRHVLLMRSASLFNKCLSPVMFYYLFTCTVVFCLTAYQITVDTSMENKIVTVEYLIYNVLELFMFSWHANEVFNASLFLSYGPYESIWWTRSIKLKRNIYILSAQFNKLIIFSAGPFTDLTVATFISIIKGAYSYYTLLRQSQE